MKTRSFRCYRMRSQCWLWNICAGPDNRCCSRLAHKLLGCKHVATTTTVGLCFAWNCVLFHPSTFHNAPGHGFLSSAVCAFGRPTWRSHLHPHHQSSPGGGGINFLQSPSFYVLCLLLLLLLASRGFHERIVVDRAVEARHFCLWRVNL